MDTGRHGAGRRVHCLGEVCPDAHMPAVAHSDAESQPPRSYAHGLEITIRSIHGGAICGGKAAAWLRQNSSSAAAILAAELS